MQPKHIRIHKAIADQIKMLIMHTKILSTWQLINMELKESLLEIKKKKQLPELLKMSGKSIKSTPHHGRKAETDEIVDWILINRSSGISVSSWEVIIKVCSLNNILKSKTLNTYKNSVINFSLN